MVAFPIDSNSNRVNIEYVDSRLEPRQLQAIFQANLPLLLEIFNPQGWCARTGCPRAFPFLGRRSFTAAAHHCRHPSLARRRLELTYVDAALRVGRDDKGHVFVLERIPDSGVAAAL